MNTIFLAKRFLLALTIVFFVSCDTDFTEIGANVVDGDIHNSLTKYDADIKAYDKATGAVQSNNLAINTLGIYDNPVFGTTTATYVTQVQLASANINPTFNSPVLDSVWIYIPYTSTLTASATTNSTAKYTLSGIYGDTVNTIKLDIKRNNFYLRDSDAASGGTAGQKYYSDEQQLIENAAGESLLASGDTIFRYSAGVVKREFRYTPETEGATEIGSRETLAPGMYLPLKRSTFETLIFAAGGTGNLLNNSVFTNYFRGLYFDVEQNGRGSVMGTPDFTKGVITMKYRDSVITATSRTQVKKTLTLNLTGNKVNFFKDVFTGAFESAVAVSNTNTEDGDDRLYLKGGAGSMAFLDISNATIASIRAAGTNGEKVLINEANLVFNVDQVKMQPLQDRYVANNARVEEPIRIFLYDVNNKRPLYDYYTDGTTVTSNNKYSKYVHGGLLERSSDGRGTQYKIRITEHINNLVNKDSTNVKLGLVVTEDINVVTNAALKAPWDDEPWMNGVPPVQAVKVNVIPTAAVMHEFGTVLYGNNIPEGDPNYDKRLKLEIFYTKPE